MRLFQVDAFTDRVFGGNPAAVVPLETWPTDDLLQSIAMENNLAETAFIIAGDPTWELRWFTPRAEVALCGHATLAAAHVVFEHLGFTDEEVHFQTRKSGVLSVRKLDTGLSMSFPAIQSLDSDDKECIEAAITTEIVDLKVGYYSSDEYDFLAIVKNQEVLSSLEPDFIKIGMLESRGLIVSARGVEADFVSRYFAPQVGVDEDPVTGSAHCILAPYWSALLGMDSLQARQLSSRGGDILCKIDEDRVHLIGNAVDYLSGSIRVVE